MEILEPMNKTVKITQWVQWQNGRNRKKLVNLKIRREIKQYGKQQQQQDLKYKEQNPKICGKEEIKRERY